MHLLDTQSQTPCHAIGILLGLFGFGEALLQKAQQDLGFERCLFRSVSTDGEKYWAVYFSHQLRRIGTLDTA